MSVSLNWEHLSSSNVAACAYDAEAHALYVRFNSGNVYRYANVPEAVYAALKSAASPGQYMHRSIHGQFSSSKLS